MKVLIIDDEPSVRRALQRAFKAKGHEVHTAVDGIDGEEVWLKERPQIVILDVLMPKLTGPQLLEKLESLLNSYTVKIILISAYSGDFDTKESEAKGASLFIKKPFENIFSVVEKAEELIL